MDTPHIINVQKYFSRSVIYNMFGNNCIKFE